MFEKIKEKVISWVFGAVCAVVCGAAVIIISCCGKADVSATVTLPDIKIYIKGEINSPGLYETSADTRLVELIELAGGATENADLQRLNLAAILTDGTTVIIPAVGSDVLVDPKIALTSQNDYESTKEQDKAAVVPNKITSGTININTAPAAELMRLPGVGEATANKIISYREANGNFLVIEELMNVSGVGEKTFEKMKPFLAVE